MPCRTSTGGSPFIKIIDAATYRLTRQLPGVPFHEPCRTESFMISDPFYTPATGSAPVTPQLIIPGQQVQSLARLGLNLRELVNERTAEEYEEVLESLKFVDKVSTSLRQPDGLMKRQLLYGVCKIYATAVGLGCTIDLFFFSLRQLLSVPSLHESNNAFYICAFKIITSHWEESKDSLGTVCILLNIVYDLIIPGRGVFSDFSYPGSIVTTLLNIVSSILRESVGPYGPIRGAVWEIENRERRLFNVLGHETAEQGIERFRGLSQFPWPE
ncbi:hypothetical protein V8E53_005502 [Lactarius tabidus]